MDTLTKLSSIGLKCGWLEDQIKISNQYLHIGLCFCNSQYKYCFLGRDQLTLNMVIMNFCSCVE